MDHTAVLGGGELALLALVRALDADHYRPTVLLFSDGPLVRELNGVAETEVLELPDALLSAKRGSLGVWNLLWKKSSELIRFMVRLARRVRCLKPDVVHTNSLKANLIGGLVGRLTGIPVVWHVRDRIDEDYLPRPVVWFVRILCRVIPHAVIANSSTTLETLRLPPSAHAVAISSGVDLLPFVAAGSRHESLSQRLAANRAAKIGIIGRIAAWKGQDIFLRAAAIIHETWPAAEFFIVGAALFDDGEQEELLQSLVTELGLATCTRFLGFRRDIPEVIGELDIVVHASTIPEPFGQVIIQGMAAGKPVIASEGGGASEIIEHGRTGYLSPRGDSVSLARAIEKILLDPAAAEEVARRGQAHATALYSAEATTRAVEAVYQRLTGDRSAQRPFQLHEGLREE